MLTGVSCTSASFCMAVGDYVNSGGHLQTLTEAWNGKSWSLVSPANTNSNQSQRVTGVSCTSASFCMAVGYGATVAVTCRP